MYFENMVIIYYILWLTVLEILELEAEKFFYFNC